VSLISCLATHFWLKGMVAEICGGSASSPVRVLTNDRMWNDNDSPLDEGKSIPLWFPATGKSIPLWFSATGKSMHEYFRINLRYMNVRIIPYKFALHERKSNPL